MNRKMKIKRTKEWFSNGHRCQIEFSIGKSFLPGIPVLVVRGIVWDKDDVLMDIIEVQHCPDDIRSLSKRRAIRRVENMIRIATQ